jgi:hypothetical protein
MNKSAPPVDCTASRSVIPSVVRAVQAARMRGAGACTAAGSMRQDERRAAEQLRERLAPPTSDHHHLQGTQSRRLAELKVHRRQTSAGAGAQGIPSCRDTWCEFERWPPACPGCALWAQTCRILKTGQAVVCQTSSRDKNCYRGGGRSKVHSMPTPPAYVTLNQLQNLPGRDPCCRTGTPSHLL